MKKNSSTAIVDNENQADCRRAKGLSLIIHAELGASSVSTSAIFTCSSTDEDESNLCRQDLSSFNQGKSRGLNPEEAEIF